MSETPGDEKDNEVVSDKKAEEPKKTPDLHDTISRMLRREIPTGVQKEDDSTQ